MGKPARRRASTPTVRLALLLVPVALLAAGCATGRGTAPRAAGTTAYVKADIERQLAAGESLRALQNIWTLETREPPPVAAGDLRGLRRSAVSALRDELALARREERYQDALALANSLAAVGEADRSGQAALLAELYHGEVHRLIGAGLRVSALLVGLRAVTEGQLPASDLPVLRDLAVEEGSRYALTVLKRAAADDGRELPVPDLPPPATYAEMLGGTVTVWVDRGVTIHRGVGFPDRVIGSGFFIDRDGHLLTNYHVISSEVDPAYEGYSRLFIRLSENPDERVPAKVVGYDPVFDLALLKAEVAPDYVFSAVAAASPAPGDPVTAIGTPGDISLAKTVTSGIVSAVGRRFLQVGDALQVDAPLNPGNSGGPLLDRNRELVGITFAGMEQFEGINFGIGSEWIKRVLPKLYTGGAVSHLWLGASVHRRDAELVVDYVVPGAPADLAGVAAGDVLLRVGEQVADEIVAVQRYLLGFGAPALVAIEVRRGSREMHLLALLGGRPFSPLEVALQRDSWQDTLVPLFGLGVEHVRRTLFRDEFRVTVVVPGSVAADSRISVEDPVWLEDFALDESLRTAYLRLVVRKRLTGYLEASIVLSAPLEQNNLL